MLEGVSPVEEARGAVSGSRHRIRGDTEKDLANPMARISTATILAAVAEDEPSEIPVVDASFSVKFCQLVPLVASNCI
jgi:hypothetical protein